MQSRPAATPVLRLVTAAGVSRNGRTAPSSPTVRMDKIRTARARISAGYYDRPDVRERVLSALLDELERS